VVLLSGEPGIGKSRLTAALMERQARVRLVSDTLFAFDQRRRSSSSSSSRPTSSVNPPACRASNRLSTDAGLKAAQARTWPDTVGAMIDGVIGNKALPADIRQDIVERTDGIPLFVEEREMAMTCETSDPLLELEPAERRQSFKPAFR
jgi:hypothetical protein